MLLCKTPTSEIPQNSSLSTEERTPLIEYSRNRFPDGVSTVLLSLGQSESQRLYGETATAYSERTVDLDPVLRSEHREQDEFRYALPIRHRTTRSR